MPGKKEDILGREEPIHIARYGQLVWKKFRSHRLALIGSSVLLFLLAFTLIGPMLQQNKYDDMDFDAMFSPPFSKNHFLGTDELGHDVFVRIMYGGRISLFVGFISAILTSLIGTVIGLLSGYFGGIVDRLCMRFVDIMLSLPVFPILLILTMVVGSGMVNIITVLVLLGWMRIARLVRGQTLTLREADYVLAAKVMGVKHLGIMGKHILPNVIPIIIVAATLNVSYAILAESALSYLGLGIQPPTPSWGNMLQRSMNYILGSASDIVPWWLTFFPGFLIFMSVLNINFLGDGLRDALDPKFVSEI